MPLLLGLDIGTTSTIGILIDETGATRATASRPCVLYSDHANWSEEDAGQWWQNSCAITRELLAKSGRPAAEIAGIGVTGMLPAVVLLDREGRVLRRSIQQNDARALDEIAARLNLTNIGRHTALGDAIVTAEVLLKLIPLLEARGIITLNDALQASTRSPYASLSY